MTLNSRYRKHKWVRQFSQKTFGIILFALVLLILTGGGFAHGGNAKYIILFIGDGWGHKHIEAVNKYTGTTPSYQLGSPWVQYMVSTFPEGGGYDKTQAWLDFNYVNTTPGTQDSACTASSIYSGSKTSPYRMSVSSDASTRFFTIVERAKELGKAVGAISTVPASHATPGAWVAHNDDRVNTFAIADEGFFGDPNTTGTVATDTKYGGGHGSTMPPVDVMIGARGTNYISNQILDKLRAENGQAGKHVLVERQTGVDGGDALMSAANNSSTLKLAGLFDHVYHNANGSGYNSENPTLSESVLAAIEVLDRNSNGFVLMVEGGAIDWASHANNMNQMIGEAKDFDEAVQTITNWVDDPDNDVTWSNTLVIVTADHECGYLTAGPVVFPDQPLGNVNSANLNKEKIVLSTDGRRASWDDTNNNSIIDINETVYWYWNSGAHTNSLVPLYARGTGAELFEDYVINYDPVLGPYLDNTDVFSVMNSVIGSNGNIPLFTAYNDLSWSTGQVNTMISLYTTGQNGLLKDYFTGTNTPVTLTIAGGDTSHSNHLIQGGNANSGTDAYTVFNSIVNSVGLISYSDTNLTFTFTGLDPDLNYEFVLFGNRNNTSYTNRMTTTTISDVVSFTNASTPGATFSGETDPAVTIVNGYNTVNGYVARFTNINSGADGDMLITVSSPTSQFYANALMLRATQSPDTTPPTVSATSPVSNATGVSVNSAITATFNEAMNASSITTATFLVNNGSVNIGGTVTYSGTTATFTPSANLSYSTKYTATITTGVTDESGNAMLTDYTWNFTTGVMSDITPPEVSETSPVSNATGVAVDSVITATFNEAMDPATINTATFTVGGVTGTVSYNGTSNTAVFTPTANLSYDTFYTATITTWVTDASGNAMLTDYMWNFTTGVMSDITPPEVRETSPVSNATGVAVDSVITATFNEAMDPATINTATFTVGGVTGTVSYNGTSNTAMFTPTANLSYDTFYTATITTWVTDASGNAMLTDYTWNFTTVGGVSPDGMQAYYRFDESSGTTAADSSGSGNNGTLIKGPVWTTGKINNALSFDGANDYVEVPNSDSLNPTTYVTVSAWIYPTAAGKSQDSKIISKRHQTLANDNYSLGFTSTNKPQARVVVGGSSKIIDGPVLSLNAWHHIVEVYNGSTLKLYVNGAEVASVAASGAIDTSTHPLRIGTRAVDPKRKYFKGRIDEVRVYNRALSSQEVLSLFK